ncbi:MAG: glycosyltransferase family 2 protein [Gammaproteobacteria bacterium]|nr:glycosyltransferase family 2 protein [Gammaproteobacteria bacterium]
MAIDDRRMIRFLSDWRSAAGDFVGDLIFLLFPGPGFRRRDILDVWRSPFWSSAWYRRRYFDGKGRGSSLRHFFARGEADGHDPGPYFENQRIDRAGSGKAPRKFARLSLLEFAGSGLTYERACAVLRDPRKAVRDSGLWDEAWYLERYPDVKASGKDPLTHYCKDGAMEMRQPGPLFAPALYVSTARLARKPGLNPLLHYLINAENSEESRGEVSRLRTHAIEQWAQTVDLDADLRQTGADLKSGRLAYVRPGRLDRAALAWLRLGRTLTLPYSLVIVLPAENEPQAVLAARDLARAAIERHGIAGVLLVASDRGYIEHSWPPGTHIQMLSNVESELGSGERAELLLWLLLALKPRSVLNVHSEVAWDVFEQFGKALSVFMSLNAVVFRVESDVDPLDGGFAHRYFRSTVASLGAVYSSDEVLLADLARTYAIGSGERQKLKPLRTADAIELPAGRARASDGPTKLSFSPDWPLDVTVVVNAHKEGCLAHPTVQSLSRCLGVAHARGLKTEVIVVMDRPDLATLEYFHDHAPSDWKVERVDLGDLGKARNHGALLARGQFVAFIDADDLFGSNWISAACHAARKEARPAVWHPEVSIYFGAAAKVMCHVDADDPSFDPLSIVSANQWTALAFASADLLRRVPYPASDISNQIGFEDWGWNEATMADGCIHKVVRDTAHFIRVKRYGSLVGQTTAARSIHVPAGILPGLLGREDPCRLRDSGGEAC